MAAPEAAPKAALERACRAVYGKQRQRQLAPHERRGSTATGTTTGTGLQVVVAPQLVAAAAREAKRLAAQRQSVRSLTLSYVRGMHSTAAAA